MPQRRIEKRQIPRDGNDHADPKGWSKHHDKGALLTSKPRRRHIYDQHKSSNQNWKKAKACQSSELVKRILTLMNGDALKDQEQKPTRR